MLSNRRNFPPASSAGKINIYLVVNIILSSALGLIVLALLSNPTITRTPDSTQISTNKLTQPQANAQIAAQQRADEIANLKTQIQLEALKIQIIRERARLTSLGRVTVQDKNYDIASYDSANQASQQTKQTDAVTPALQAKSIRQQLSKSLVSASDEDFQLLVNLRQLEKRRQANFSKPGISNISPDTQVDYLNRVQISPSSQSSDNGTVSLAALQPQNELELAVKELMGQIINRSTDIIGGTTDQDEKLLQQIDVVSKSRRNESRTITVQPGDTLWIIASRAYKNGDLYPRIMDANPQIITNPDLIKVGQVLRVPF